MLAFDAQRVAMGASLAVAVLMLVGKLGAAYITGSDAILSDAAESIVHIVATSVAAFSLWYAAQPADKQHPYGHGKIAYFSAGFEGAMIFSAAVSIVGLSVHSLIVGPEVRELGVGVLITGSLGFINLVLGLSLIHVGKRRGSLVLVANGKHVLTDMWTSAGVVVGVLIVWWTGVVWLDPIVAILAGLNILYSGGALLKTAFDGLMERVSEEDSERIIACLEALEGEGVVESFHQLHFRRVGSDIWLEVHLLFPVEASLVEAHGRASECERRISALFPDDQVHATTHMEPSDHSATHPEGHPETLDPLTQPSA